MRVLELRTKLWGPQTVTWEPRWPGADETSLEQQGGSVIVLGECVARSVHHCAGAQTPALSRGPQPRRDEPDLSQRGTVAPSFPDPFILSPILLFSKYPPLSLFLVLKILVK